MTLDPTTGRTFAYNVEDQLTSSALGGTTTTLAYDPLGRLDSYNPGTFTRFVYDGIAVAADLDPTGVITHRYVRTDDPDELLAVYSDAGTASHRWVTNDERGSVLVQADASGVAQAISSYDEYGVPASGNTGRFGYTGQLWLSEIGLYDYKARMYLPGEAIFPQPDPIGQADDPNLYAFVRNDPVNFIDPLGLTPCTEETTVCGHCTGGTVAVAANTPAGIMCVAESVVKPKENQVGPGGPFGPAIGTPEAPTTPVAPPQQQNQCPTGALGRLRNGANGVAKFTGGAGAVLGLAGAIPTPATPVLESAAGIATGASRLATGVAIGVDLIYGIGTGRFTAFNYDFLSATVGELPLGNAANKIQEMTGGEASQFGKELGNGGMFAVGATIPNPCG